MSIPDRIEKTMVVAARLERVWRAISDAKEFGTWFGMEFDGPFVAGHSLRGRIMPTSVDAEIARAQEPYKGMVFIILVDRIEPMHLFSFRWHPSAVDIEVDYSGEPMTRVEFRLEEVEAGTKVTFTESGFHDVPLARRAEAFRNNDEGWTMQTMLLRKYLEP